MSAPDTEVLMTGFGPFPGVARNPSGWLVQTLAHTSGAAPGCGLTAAVLPVGWRDAWGTLEPLLDSLRPRHVILFGVAAQAQGFRLEHRAHNAVAAREDAHGEHPEGERILSHGPDTLDATLPFATVAAALAAAGLPVEISHDPGRYLCNALLYHTLHWSRANPPARAGFVHIPHHDPENPDAAPPLDGARLLTGARLIVETAIRQSRKDVATV
ncbi:MAG: pyroglutamyl-peptidase I [Dichotomicrobium sp.]